MENSAYENSREEHDLLAIAAGKEDYVGQDGVKAYAPRVRISLSLLVFNFQLIRRYRGLKTLNLLAQNPCPSYGPMLTCSTFFCPPVLGMVFLAKFVWDRYRKSLFAAVLG